jgi:hypothetical protein
MSGKTGDATPLQDVTPASVAYGATSPQKAHNRQPQEHIDYSSATAPAVATCTPDTEEPLIPRRDSIGEWHPEYDAMFKEAKPSYQYYVTVFGSLFLVFSSMTTLGTFAASFQNSVPTSVRARHPDGPTSFDNMCSYLRWMPMFYGGLCFLVFSNTAAELVFYTSLRRGKITVMPSVQSAKDVLYNPVQLFFIVVTVSYAVSAVVIMNTLDAETGVIIGFLTTLAMGAGAQWLRLTLAPSYFLSLSDYIALFPNRDGKTNECDNVARDNAVQCLATVDVRASQVHDLRSNWPMLKVSRTAMGVLSVTMVVSLVALALAASAIASASRKVQQQSWAEINPCVEACSSSMFTLTGNATEVCTTCICKCGDALSFLHSWQACKQDITVAQCAAHCPEVCGD